MTDLNAFLPYVNGPLGFLFRHALWIPDRRHRIVKLTPEACHLHLGGNRYRGIFYASAQFSEAAYQNLGWFMRSLHRWDMATRRLPAFNMGFDTFTAQPNETNSSDTRIDSSNATTNYNATGLSIGESDSAPGIFRTLIRFQFTSISWIISVNSATLSLWQNSEAASTTRTCRVYRQKRAWVEAQATWNIYSTGNNWDTSGGFGTNDCEQTDIGSLSLSSTESNGEKQWSLTAVAVEQMFIGLWTNNGFLMKMDTEVNDRHNFLESSYGTASERPKLVVDYTSQDTGGLLL